MDRRSAGEPLEQVLGWAEFCGLRVAVEPGVFVPRRRTELLVREASARARPGAVVVDLCCGSGAVAAAVGATLDRGALHGVEIDPAAARCARRNLAALGGRVHDGDLYDALPAALRGRVDLLVANAPYVPSGELGLLPPEARTHEPRVALDGGVDGLDVHRRIAAGACGWLVPGGALVIETSERQSAETARACARGGLVPAVARSEELDATVVVAIRSATRAGHPARPDPAGRDQ